MPKTTFLNLPDDKRQLIIDVAIEEFSDHPYRRASLSQICNRANIAKGSIYQYFDNKLGLYRFLIMEEAVNRKLRYFQDHLASRAPGDGYFEQLSVLTYASLAFTVDNPRIGRMVFNAIEPSADPELRHLHHEIRNHSHQYMRDMIQTAIASGEIREGVNADSAAYFVSSVLGRGLLDALLDHLDSDLTDLLQKPEITKRLTTEDHHQLVDSAIDLLKRGLS